MKPHMYTEGWMQNFLEKRVELYTINVYTIIVWGFKMLKNITLSADENIIKKAREKASKCNRSLNSIFREWLNNFINQDNMYAYDDVMKRIEYAQSGGKFTRDEMNER